MSSLIVLIVIALILFFAVRYIYREKKKGKVCVGCPYADSCGHNCSGSCRKQ